MHPALQGQAIIRAESIIYTVSGVNPVEIHSTQTTKKMLAIKTFKKQSKETKDTVMRILLLFNPLALAFGFGFSSGLFEASFHFRSS
jgi:hypothetical protein